MASITINGTAYNDFVSGFSAANAYPSAGVYYALPPFGKPPRAGFKVYEEIQTTFPGVDGIGLKRMGFRGLSIACDLIITDSSKANVGTKLATLRSSLSGLARYTITVPEGTAFQGCKLVWMAAAVVDWVNIADRHTALAVLVFNQYSETN